MKLLEELEPSKVAKPVGRVNSFTRQLVQGDANEERLKTAMDKLGQIKSGLLLKIQISNVGVMKTTAKQLVANAEVIQRIDVALREEVGCCEGLRIARLLKGKRPSGGATHDNSARQELTLLDNGTVPLTPDDLRSLSREQHMGSDSAEKRLVDSDSGSSTHTASTMARTERIILRNATRR